jgi:hypothetical protein
MIITKNKISSNPSNIYGWSTLVEPFSKFETPPSDSIQNSWNCSPKFGTVPTPVINPTSNYFRSVRRRWNPRVPLRLSHRELRAGTFYLSIRPTVHLQSTNLCSAPARVVFFGEPPPCCTEGFSVSLFLPPLTFPGGGAPTPSSPSNAPLPPDGRRRRLAGSAPPCAAPSSPLPLPWLRGRRRERRKKMIFCNLVPVSFNTYA